MKKVYIVILTVMFLLVSEGVSRAELLPTTYAWHTFYGSSGDNEGGGSIGVDSNGNIYITGSSNGTWNGPAGQSPLHAHSGGRTDAFVLKLNSNGVYQWHTFYGDGSGWLNGSQGTGVALDDSGNVYITGQSNGSWAGPSGEAPLHPYDGYGSDILVLKLDTNGAYQWHTYYGGGSNESGYGIAVGGGNVYVTGPASNTMTGPAGQPPLHAYAGGHVPFVVLKLNSSGAYQWHTFYGSDYSYGHAIAVDDGGSVYVTGDSDCPWYGPSAEDPLNPWAGGSCWNAWRDIFVLKLNTNGAYQWHTFYAYAGNGNVGYGIAVDGSRNVYVTGQSFVPWNGPLGQNPLNPFGTSGAYRDLFVLKLDTNGAYDWHTFYGGGAGENSGSSIAVDANGNVYVTGHTDSFDHWNGPSGQSPLYAYTGGILALKLDTSGTYQWHTFYGQSGGDGGGGIALDGNRNIYVTGASYPGWNGPGGQLPLNPYSGSWDIVALKMKREFGDVPLGNWAYNFIMEIYNAGITGGCSTNPPLFCPNNTVTRGQMAVFMESSLGVKVVPSCTGTVFNDVNAGTVGPAFCGFIEDFAARGITGGCGGGNYCPNTPVTRWQMAVFIDAALGRIPGQLPPTCSGTFNDVNASTVGTYVCRIIEDFALQGITGGCGGGNFCPSSPVTRAQMAVFLVAAPPPLSP